jgi:hypothetical protein
MSPRFPWIFSKRGRTEPLEQGMYQTTDGTILSPEEFCA